MKQATNFAEDAQLTAYALGELDGEERAAIEARLRDDAAAQAAVAEIRATAARLDAALANEPLEAKPAAAEAAQRTSTSARGWWRGTVAIGTALGGLAAAGVALIVLRPQGARPTEIDQGAKMGVVAPEAARSAAAAKGTARTGTAAAPVAQLAAESKSVGPAQERSWFEQAAGAGPALAPVTGDLSLRGQVARQLTEKQRQRFVPATLGVSAAEPAEGRSDVVRFSGSETPRAHPRSWATMEAGGHALAASYGYIGEARRDFVVDAAALTRSKRAFPGQLAMDHYIGGAPARGEFNTEAYAYRAESEFLAAEQNPLSTFSADVDTASYANVRRFIEAGRRPPADAVRIEELVNYFPYRYAPPQAGSAAPFAAALEVAEAPWAPGHRLVRIGLKGREVAAAERAPANLVFLLDVSGSMAAPNKLPLVKTSLRLLLGRLRADDRVAIVTYAGASGLALPSTPVAKAREIEAALDELQPGGSTNGAMGIQLAYDIAKANFASGGINRVVLCTDGDFNVGVTSEGELVRLIREKAKTGVFLTVLGFGMGNYQDARLQQLADAGNGNYGYIDTSREAEKLLVEQVSGTLVTIAKDVKLQVEFNPATVARYRLIGYEKRLLKQEDFNDDQVDAGEIGSGHTVTALYEIVPVGAADAAASGAGVDELKYRRVEIPEAKGQTPKGKQRGGVENELLTLKVRYKEPAGEVSRKLEFPLTDVGARFERASEDFKFAAAVAAFGMVLRDSPHRGSATLADVAAWAEAGASADPGGYRAEFVGLVKKAAALP